MKKEKRNIFVSIILIAVTILLYLLATYCKTFFFSFYPYLSAYLISILSYATSFIKYSLWESIAFIIIIYLLIALIFSIKKKKYFLWITKVILVLTILVTSFINIWGLNYFSEDLYQRFEYKKEQYYLNQLYQLTDYLVEKCNEYADLVERDKQGRMTTDFDLWNKQLSLGYAKIKESLPYFVNINQRVKILVSSKYYSQRGITGIFICLTGEASITSEVYNVAIPLTMAHEVAHRNTITREDEANFIAYLACINNENVAFQYSGYFEAFLYCANNLISLSEEAYAPIREKINENLRFDILDNSGFYQQRTDEQKEQANNDLYNSYLDAFGIENGMESYSEMVQLLLCWYYQDGINQ